ncbi:protein FAM107B isoform X2 [Brachyhypopomus gauderio]|uniref:protein FAM107B isoform X2 n=1 Tax=Brachyhypopomus gauderio TaxID=698409 RepID=UPI0040411C63
MHARRTCNQATGGMDHGMGHRLYPESPPSRPRDVLVKSASAYANIQWEQPHQPGEPLQFPRMERLPVASYVTQPDDVQGDEDLIKPKKLINPVKASKSHQELHRELLQNHQRGVENKSELQRVLEQRKRDQLIKQRKMEEEARRKVSPLEQELLKRHQKLDELEREQERQEENSCNAPEFIKVKENLRRTSFTSTEEKEV